MPVPFIVVDQTVYSKGDQGLLFPAKHRHKAKEDEEDDDEEEDDNALHVI